MGVSGGADGFIYLWDLSNYCSPSPIPHEVDASCIDKYRGHTDAIWDLDSHPTDAMVLSAGADGKIILWKLGHISPLIATFSHHYHSDPQKPFDNPSSVSWNPSNLSTFVSSHISGNVSWNWTVYSQIYPKILILIKIRYVSKTSQYNNPYYFVCLWFIYQILQILIWDIKQSTSPLRVFEESIINKSLSSEFHAYTVVVHPKLPIIFSAHEDKRIRIWNAETGVLEQSIVAHQDAGIELSPNGGYVDCN